MEQMEQGNKFIKEEYKNIFLKYISYLPLAMISLIFIIAIVLIISFNVKMSKLSTPNEKIVEIANKQNVLLASSDEVLNKFIKDYFKARTDLNFNQIFASYNKKWSSTNLDAKSQEIVNAITHERSYVKKFDDILVFTVEGLREDELIAIITYNIEFSFTKDYAPSILMAYLKNDNGNYYFVSDYDMEISKYINNVLKNEEVVLLFNEVKTNLLEALKGNENLKIAYNSLRQLKDNLQANSDINYNKNIYDNVLSPIYDTEDIKKILGES